MYIRTQTEMNDFGKILAPSPIIVETTLFSASYPHTEMETRAPLFRLLLASLVALSSCAPPPFFYGTAGE